MQTKDFKNILVIQTGFIGDVILSTPVLSVLKEQYPDAKLTLVTTPVAATLFRHDTRLTEVIPFHKRDIHSGIAGFFSFMKKLRQYKFDAVFSLHKSMRTSLLVWVSGIPNRFGFTESKFSFLYSHTVSRAHYEHDVLRNLAICENINLDVRSLARPLSLQLHEDDRTYIRSILSAAGSATKIGIAPGSVWNTKRWTEKGFAEFISHQIKTGHAIILIGGESDKKVVDDILSYLDSDIRTSSLFINTVGTLNLIQSAALVSMCDAMLTNDSAPLHMASAFQVPVVALFCATVPEFGFGPWMTKHKIVQVEGLSCRPCGRHGGNICPTGTNFCRVNISSLVVHREINALLGKSCEN